jgi:hypothetical protein
LVRLPDHVTSGEPAPVTVVALDARGRPVPSYTGTVSFTSSDPDAKLPDDYTFTADDRGRHTFRVTFETPGEQSIKVVDKANESIAGSARTTVDAVGEVTHFGVRSLGIGLAGVVSPFLIVALDASNHVVTNYTGTIRFSSTDSDAVLPDAYTFTADDKGSHQFLVTFMTAGKQTLTVTDSSGAAPIIGSADIYILGDLGGPRRRFRWF